TRCGEVARQFPPGQGLMRAGRAVHAVAETMAMKRWGLVMVMAALLLAGCGSGGHVNLGGGVGGSTAANFSNASLNGPFAFMLQGSNSGGFYQAGGVMTADGGGHLSNGTFDLAPIG